MKLKTAQRLVIKADECYRLTGRPVALTCKMSQDLAHFQLCRQTEQGLKLYTYTRDIPVRIIR